MYVYIINNNIHFTRKLEDIIKCRKQNLAFFIYFIFLLQPRLHKFYEKINVS